MFRRLFIILVSPLCLVLWSYPQKAHSQDTLEPLDYFEALFLEEEECQDGSKQSVLDGCVEMFQLLPDMENALTSLGAYSPEDRDELIDEVGSDIPTWSAKVVRRSNNATPGSRQPTFDDYYGWDVLDLFDLFNTLCVNAAGGPNEAACQTLVCNLETFEGALRKVRFYEYKFDDPDRNDYCIEETGLPWSQFLDTLKNSLNCPEPEPRDRNKREKKGKKRKKNRDKDDDSDKKEKKKKNKRKGGNDESDDDENDDQDKKKKRNKRGGGDNDDGDVENPDDDKKKNRRRRRHRQNRNRN